MLGALDYLLFPNIDAFKSLFQEIHQNVKQLLVQIWPDDWSGLIWVQTVCKGFQQTTLAGKGCPNERYRQNSWKSYGIFRNVIETFAAVSAM